MAYARQKGTCCHAASDGGPRRNFKEGQSMPASPGGTVAAVTLAKSQSGKQSLGDVAVVVPLFVHWEY